MTKKRSGTVRYLDWLVQSRGYGRLGREILGLALPTMVENLFQTLVGFFDTLLIAQLGLVAVTAVGLANSLLTVYLAVYLAVGVGGTALIARSLGADQLDQARVFARQTQEVLLATGLLFGFMTVCLASPILRLMGADQATLVEARVFLVWVGGLTLLQASMTGLSTILRAAGDSLTPMKVGLVTNAVNLMVDYILVFGLGDWPGLGLLGTAWGTIVARLLGVYLLTRKLAQTDLAFDWKVRGRLRDYQELLVLALPAALERVVMRLGQVVYFSMIVGLGTTVYASHMIAGSIEAFAYMPAYGLASAATILIGRAWGKGEPKEIGSIAFLSSAYGLAISALFALVLFWGGPQLAQLFTGEAEAVVMVVTALQVAAFNQLGLAISVIMAGALQGLGDTKTPLYATLIGMWGVRVLGVYGLASYLGLGILGIWLAILLDLLLRAVFLSLRFVSQLASKMK